MQIIHQSGTPFELDPSTSLELTRYNPFFNDIGEQSLPVSLPASPHNIHLLSYPANPENKQKVSSRIDAQIQSGIFVINARQAILSAQKNGSVETSFYLNEGALNEKIKDVSLQEIFETKSISFASVDDAITFMHTLVAVGDYRFACFQVFTDDYILNESGGAQKPDGFYGFRKESQTTETVDDKEVTVPKGYYITPFVKVKHVVQEVLAYFGYSLAPSFLDNEPFSEMCFLNNNIDTIVNARIDYVDIVPDIMVTALFDILRKFNLEIIPDEKSKTIYLRFFDEQLDLPVSDNLTSNMTSEPKVNYHNDYKQLKLSSSRLTLPAELTAFTGRSGMKITTNADSLDSSFLSVLTKFPTSYLRLIDGAIVRDGFKGHEKTTEIVGSLSLDYYAGSILTSVEKPFPDTIPQVYLQNRGYGSSSSWFSYPYVGASRALHSAIQYSGSDSLQTSDTGKLEPMLCFHYRSSAYHYTIGTLSNYDYAGVKLWNHSLFYNGTDGIFERFWRRRDTLLRNALLEIEVDLLLSEKQKFSLPATQKIAMAGQNYFISQLKYVPEKNETQTGKFLSLNIQHPVSSAKSPEDYFPTRVYKWNLKYSRSFPVNALFKYKTEIVAFFPEDPTLAQFSAGGKYYQKTYEVEYGHDDRGSFVKDGDGTITVWLEAVNA